MLLQVFILKRLPLYLFLMLKRKINKRLLFYALHTCNPELLIKSNAWKTNTLL